MKKHLAILLFLGLSACSGTPGENDKILSDRKLNLEEFFEQRPRLD